MLGRALFLRLAPKCRPKAVSTSLPLTLGRHYGTYSENTRRWKVKRMNEHQRSRWKEEHQDMVQARIKRKNARALANKRSKMKEIVEKVEGLSKIRNCLYRRRPYVKHYLRMWNALRAKEGRSATKGK